MKRCEGNVQAVDQCISQKQYKEFVIEKVNAIVHPGTMMIHFQHTATADAAMMRSVRFDDFTFITKPHRTVHCAAGGKCGFDK